MTHPPTRLLICVDDISSKGPTKSSYGTNVHRIYSSIQRGICTNTVSGETFNQVAEYAPWLSHTDDMVFNKDRLQAGVLGQAYVKRIEEVYNRCSQLLPARDEVWLFGSGRGATVVRAVAGLLHTFGAMASAGQPGFGEEFKRILKHMQRTPDSAPSAIASTTASTRPPPRIQFVGAFDPIRCKHDEMFDTSFNRSISHMRQAFALHEDKESLSPTLLFPEDLNDLALRDCGRSFVQAYFVGRHNDIAGSAKRCGLAVYPCQWMWFEARQCGLVVNITEEASGAHESLFALLPEPAKKEGKKQKAKLWSFTSENGITAQIQDLRMIHRLSGDDREGMYAVRLVSPWLSSFSEKKPRSPFDTDGHLRGYCEWAPQGSIIHPSVYLLLDEYINIALETKDLNLQRNLENWRARMMYESESIGANTGFWLDEIDDCSADPGALRVLVCGNTGVGKSSLINKTFGVDVTQSSHRARGIHDVHEEITWEGRPDLIVHDSGGFEAGTDDEFLAIEAFLRERSTAETVLARVHVIWFCVDINSPRTLQSATEKLFSAVSKHAKDVPVVIVATKKDQMLDIEFGTRRKTLKKEGRPFDEEDCERYAEEMQSRRLEIIRSEMQSVPGGRLDACLAVSQDDDDAIAQLSGVTSHCFDTDRIRLLYIRAQVTRIDLKVDMAQAEILKRYKRLVRQSASTLVPLGATITRKVSNAQLTSSIMRCFGLPSVTAEAATEVLKATVWNTTGGAIQLALAEAFQLIGLSLTGLTLGSPIWLVTGGMNAAHVVPTTCRLFLIMACDMTWILARSFKNVSLRANAQPDEGAIRAAAYDYTTRGYAQHVHGAIKTLIPRRDVLASYRIQQIQQTVEALLSELKDDLKDETNSTSNALGPRMSWDDTSTEADSVLFKDAQEANAAIAELDAGDRPLLLELDGTGAIFELPAGEKATENDVLVPPLRWNCKARLASRGSSGVEMP